MPFWELSQTVLLGADLLLEARWNDFCNAISVVRTNISSRENGSPSTISQNENDAASRIEAQQFRWSFSNIAREYKS